MKDRDIEDTRQPHDEPEEEYCEECGKAMEVRLGIQNEEWHFCNNRFCPSRNDGIAKEMAQYIVELLDDIEIRDTRIKKLERKITALEFHRDEYGG